ncbi:hypothetical protein [Streptomyces sp. NPDC003023]|uniref:hypothetical protein n=1 Tax=Streptomyces sp. NPDC003023 TaxID=3364675 RepID=UPI00368B21EC
MPEDAVPLCARATVLAEEPDQRWIEDMLAHAHRQDADGSWKSSAPTTRTAPRPPQQAVA